MHKCYVCQRDLDLDVDSVCHRVHLDFGYVYRCAWHGVPGIRNTAPVQGVEGYANTLKEARVRAEYFVFDNPYAAPEVKAAEQEIIDEIDRLEKLAVTNKE